MIYRDPLRYIAVAPVEEGPPVAINSRSLFLALSPPDRCLFLFPFLSSFHPSTSLKTSVLQSRSFELLALIFRRSLLIHSHSLQRYPLRIDFAHSRSASSSAFDNLKFLLNGKLCCYHHHSPSSLATRPENPQNVQQAICHLRRRPGRGRRSQQPSWVSPPPSSVWQWDCRSGWCVYDHIHRLLDPENHHH